MMSNEVRVWDPLVRVFHWSLVVSFVVAYISSEEESDIHIIAGYVVMGLIIFRLLWGFIGTKHARFTDFVTSPANVISYIKSLADKPRRYLGHNPAGGTMILLMLITLSVVTFSGLKVYAVEEGKGPLAADIPAVTLIPDAFADDREYGREDHEEDEYGEDSEEEFWEEIHEVSANFMVFLIMFHVAAVFIMGRRHDENLVKAMISGKKKA